MLLWFLIMSIELPAPITQTDQAPEPMIVALEPADRDEYVLGAGDILIVSVEGGTSIATAASGLIPQSFCTIGSDGRLSVSGLGQVQASGLSINEAEADLSLLSRRYFPGSRVSLSLYQPRLVRIRISGMVQRPGVYPLYALQRVSDLLDLCGGLVFPASHKGWMYAGTDSTRIDLLPDPVTHMPVSDPLAREGAVVVMEACESPVFVMRPATWVSADLPISSSLQAWDVGEGMELETLLETIGGSGAGADYTRSVLCSDGSRLPIWTDSGIADVMLFAGDTLILAGMGDSVAVGGAVGEPAPVSWIPGFTGMDYVIMAGGTVAGADLNSTSLMRRGVEIADGRDALEAIPEPGDAILVPYTLLSTNVTTITLLGVMVALGTLIFNISKE